MKRPLSHLRRFVCVPLGLLWLVVIAALAVPVILFMTALYYLRSVGRVVASVRRATRGTARDET